MAEAFLNLSASEHREALGVAADRSGRPAHLHEEDGHRAPATGISIWRKHSLERL